MVSVQSTDERTLGYSGHRPGLAPERKAFCLFFCVFRYPISRQMSGLLDVSDTLLENGSCPPARAFSPEKNEQTRKSERNSKLFDFSGVQILQE